MSQIQDVRERVIAYGIRTLTKKARHYCSTCQELLVVVYFVKHLRYYMYNRKVFLLEQTMVPSSTFSISKTHRHRWRDGCRFWTHTHLTLSTGLEKGSELKSLWAQCESLEVDAARLLFRKLTGPGCVRRRHVVIPRKITDAVLEMMHDSDTAGHMGIKRTLAYSSLGVIGTKGVHGAEVQGMHQMCSEEGKRHQEVLVLTFQAHTMSPVVATSTCWLCLIISPNGLRHIK